MAVGAGGLTFAAAAQGGALRGAAGTASLGFSAAAIAVRASIGTGAATLAFTGAGHGGRLAGAAGTAGFTFAGAAAGGPFFATLLVLDPIGLPLYAARGLTAKLEPIAAAIGNQHRAGDGTLIDLTLPQFRKYRTTFSFADGEASWGDGVWPGTLVTVDCPDEVSFPVGGTPQRAVVPGSLRTENGRTFYRMRLAMMVIRPEQGFEEWNAAHSGQLVLEEV